MHSWLWRSLWWASAPTPTSISSLELMTNTQTHYRQQVWGKDWDQESVTPIDFVYNNKEQEQRTTSATTSTTITKDLWADRRDRLSFQVTRQGGNMNNECNTHPLDIVCLFVVVVAVVVCCLLFIVCLLLCSHNVRNAKLAKANQGIPV